MDIKTRELLTKSVLEIADEIDKRSIVKNGICWLTKDSTKHRPNWSATPSLYNGVAGILLFYIELYKFTANEKYLETVKQGMIWLGDHLNEQKDIRLGSFFTGNIGVAYLLILASHITQDLSLQKQAVDFVLSAKRYEGRTNDLLNGTCGVIIGLLLLDSVNRNNYYISEINHYLDKLLNSAYIGKKGVYWDRSEYYITGPCGLSHGAAGIGYTLLQVGKYFRNPSYYSLVRDVFAYENRNFSKKLKNWPDFRKIDYDEATARLFEMNYHTKNYKFFEESKDFSAWCHGATGIILARLLANEYLGKDIYNSDIRKGIERVFSNQYPSYTLCHGYGGDVMLFIELYKKTKMQVYHDKSVNLMLAAIEKKKVTSKYQDGCNFIDKEEDISLFNGLSGIGYCMLAVLEPFKVFNILSPKVGEQIDVRRLGPAYPKIKVSWKDIQRQILKGYFPHLLKRLKLRSLHKEIRLNSNVTSILAPTNASINDKEKIETIKVRLEASIKSWSLFSYKHKIQRKERESILNSDLKKIEVKTLQLSEYSVLYRARKKKLGKSDYFLIYISNYNFRSGHINISEFEFDVLRHFKKPALTSIVLNQINKKYGTGMDFPELKLIFNTCISNNLSIASLFVCKPDEV